MIARVKVGVVFPQSELPTDAASVREFAMGVERLGFHHFLAYDHVVGADPSVHVGWRGPYDVDTTFHEPLILFGFLAGITSMEFATAIIISPQRQTVLLAKQAAEVDILSGGRLRLGIGVGWNQVEYEALGQTFESRGVRQEEQVDLLRRLWTERAISFDGRFDHLTGAGISPLPLQRPVPIWLGGRSPAAYDRIGRLADGWFPLIDLSPELVTAQRLIVDSAERAGRDAALIGMEPQVRIDRESNRTLVETIGSWREAGASYVALNSMKLGLKGVSAHLEVLSEAAETLHLDQQGETDLL